MLGDIKEVVQPRLEKLTVEQKNIITDLVASGCGYTKIKQELSPEVEGGKDYRHLVESAISKIRAIEQYCIAEVGKSEDEEGFRAAIAKNFEDCEESWLVKVVDYVVAATGSYSEYQETFK